ncbi:GxxExxY protein [Patescibacteria group bacterium]|nr:GxxExxY protein [Patescibacteria group bacterium]
MLKTEIRRKDLIYPELSYQIMGILFDVWKEVGAGHKENFYQRAAANDFRNGKLSFEEQLPVKINYKGKFIGIYYFDFLIDSKIILEIKVRNYFRKKDIDQLYSYLRARKLKLGIIAHFTNTGVKFKRIVNG